MCHAVLSHPLSSRSTDTLTLSAANKNTEKDYSNGSEDGQAAGNRKAIAKSTAPFPSTLPPTSDYLSQPAGK